jgi:hypothetical protein
MPQQGSDTVQVKTLDGKVWSIPKANLSQAQSRGAKLVDQPAAPTPKKEHGEFVKGFSSSLGLSSPDLSWGQIGKEVLGNTIKGVTSEVGSLRKAVGEEKGIPVIGTPFTDVLAIPHLIARGAEGMASGLEGGSKDVASGNVKRGGGELLGTSAQIAGGMEGRAAASKVPPVVSSATKEFAKELVGIGEKDIAKTISDSASKVDKAKSESAEAYQKALNDHAAKVDKVVEATAKKIQKASEAKIEASKSKSAAETKQAALKTKRGPVYQKLVEQADAAQKSVKTMDTKIRAVENAKWNAFEGKKWDSGNAVKDTPVDWTAVQKAVQNAETETLQGSPENIAIFRNILKEGSGGGILEQASIFKNAGPVVDVKEIMRGMGEGQRAKFLADMKSQGIDPLQQAGSQIKEGIAIPFKDARGYYTELGEKLYGARNLPGDVRRALRQVREAVDGEITNTVAKAGGKDAISTYRQLKSHWRDYMEAFYDKDSPVRKLKEGLDPNDKLTPITGSDGARLIDLLGKYRNYDPQLVNQLGRLRSLHTSIKELPSSKGAMPQAVEKPKLPNAPAEPEPSTAQPMSAEQARLAKIQQAAQSYAHPPSRWELMFPPLLAYRLAIKKLLQSETVQKSLSRD